MWQTMENGLFCRVNISLIKNDFGHLTQLKHGCLTLFLSLLLFYYR